MQPDGYRLPLGRQGELHPGRHTPAFLDFKKTQNVDKTGSKEANSFLLVIPCSEQGVFVGDKVLLGSGP